MVKRHLGPGCPARCSATPGFAPAAKVALLNFTMLPASTPDRVVRLLHTVHVGQGLCVNDAVFVTSPSGIEPLDEPAERAEMLLPSEGMLDAMFPRQPGRRVLHEPQSARTHRCTRSSHFTASDPYWRSNSSRRPGQVGVPRSQTVAVGVRARHAQGPRPRERVQEGRRAARGDRCALFSNRNSRWHRCRGSRHSIRPQRAGVVAVLFARGSTAAACLAQLRAVDASAQQPSRAKESWNQMMVTVHRHAGAEGNVCAVEFVHDGAGVRTPDNNGRLRVRTRPPPTYATKLHGSRCHVPPTDSSSWRKPVVAAAESILPVFATAAADGQPSVAAASASLSEGARLSFEVAPDLVLGEAQLVGFRGCAEIRLTTLRSSGNSFWDNRNTANAPGDRLSTAGNALHDLAVRDGATTSTQKRVARFVGVRSRPAS